MEKTDEWIFEPVLTDTAQLERDYFKRMGYGPQTDVPPRIIAHARDALDTGLKIARPIAIVKLADVLTITENAIHAKGISIESCLWAGLAAQSSPPLTLAVFALTLGRALSDEAVNAKKLSLSRAYFLHEAGSQIIEQAADLLEIVIQGISALEHRVSSRRFSPGYCDISLLNQKEFFRFLNPGQIGIRVTASGSMLPEKSITAALLFSEKLPSISPCPECGNESCPNRRGKRRKKHPV